MKPDDFRDSPAGRVVRVQYKALDYWAFVPNPLPPEIVWDSALIQALSRADRALGELSGMGRMMPNPPLLVGPFLHREAVLSSRIEGTQADVADLYAFEAGEVYVAGDSPPPPRYDVEEVRNYVRALEHGLEQLQAGPIGLELIRELHRRLMEGVGGERVTPGALRDRQNWIGIQGSTLDDAEFVPPPTPLMHEALQELERYLQSEEDTPPLARLALIHYQFEVIHPFLDGNGRIGRLLLSLLLVHWGLLSFPLLHLSAYFERNRTAYYDRLLAVSREGAWNTWLCFFLEGVTEQAHDAVERANSLQALQGQWRTHLQEERAPGWTLGLVDMLFEQPVVSAGDVQERFEVTHPTAMSALQRLEGMGIVREMTGRQRNRVYAAEAIFDMLH